jgi:flagellar motor switch protein FliG
MVKYLVGTADGGSKSFLRQLLRSPHPEKIHSIISQISSDATAPYLFDLSVFLQKDVRHRNGRWDEVQQAYINGLCTFCVAGLAPALIVSTQKIGKEKEATSPQQTEAIKMKALVAIVLPQVT